MVHESTKSPTKRQRRRTARTRELVDLALAIVERDGVEGLTMPRLAEDAGAAVGGLYRYFAGKDDLLVAMQVRGIEAFAAVQAVALAAPAPPGLSEEARSLWAVCHAVEAWPTFAAQHPDVYALVDGSLSDPTPLLPEAAALAVHTALEPVLERLTARLDAAVQAGALVPGDGRLRTHALWAVVHGVQHFAKRDRLLPGALHACAVRREILHTLLVGWGAHPAWVAELPPN